MSRLRLFLALSACALVILPAVAQAKPHVPGFARTFPHAAKLCTKSDHGKLPKKLQASAADVAAACATLHTGFTTARTAFVTTAKPIEKQAVGAVRTAVKACRAAHKSHTAGACKTARKAAIVTLKSLRTQLKTAVKTYRTQVQSSRSTFWTTIKALPGAAGQPTDSGTPPAPGADVPADSAVA
jgi:hypothetical protein